MTIHKPYQIGLFILTFFLTSVYAQTLSVKFPNGGQSFPLNATIPITWNADKINAPIKILLINKDLNKTFVIENSYNIHPEWPYNWKVGKVISGGVVNPGTHYFIRVETTDGKYSDESDQSFSITSAKKIIITYPTSFNVWSLKSQRMITWQNPGNVVGAVRLILKPQASATNILIKENIPINTLKSMWTVGDNLSAYTVTPGKYRLFIETMDHQNSDQTDWFSITPPTSYSLNPQISNYWWYSRYRWRNPLCGASLDTKGVAPQDVSANVMRVGFDNYYTSSFCEKYYLGHAYRGFLKFDLSQIKGKVVKAKLVITKSSTTNWTGDTASNVGNCAGGIYIMDAPITGFNSASHFYLSLSSSQNKNTEIDVTTIVQGWVDNKIPNNGFMLIGTNENFNHNNNACVTIYSPILLNVDLQSFI